MYVLVCVGVVCVGVCVCVLCGYVGDRYGYVCVSFGVCGLSVYGCVCFCVGVYGNGVGICVRFGVCRCSV